MQPTSAAALQHRISLSEHELESLASVAMHPRARSVLAKAKLDLSTAALRLTRGVNTADLENLTMWLCFVEERIEWVRNAVTAGGPFALPTFRDE